jgi:hypothetical protein
MWEAVVLVLNSNHSPFFPFLMQPELTQKPDVKPSKFHKLLEQHAHHQHSDSHDQHPDSHPSEQSTSSSTLKRKQRDSDNDDHDGSSNGNGRRLGGDEERNPEASHRQQLDEREPGRKSDSEDESSAQRSDLVRLREFVFGNDDDEDTVAVSHVRPEPELSQEEVAADTAADAAADGFTPPPSPEDEMFQRIEHNDVEGVLALLAAHGDNLANATDANGLSAIHVAAAFGFADVVKALLEHQVDPNSTTPTMDTPLHLAVYGNHLQVVSVLLMAGSDPALRNSDNLLPRNLITEDTNAAIVSLLG